MKKTWLTIIIVTWLFGPVLGQTSDSVSLSPEERFLLLKIDKTAQNTFVENNSILVGLAGILFLELEKMGRIARDGPYVVLLDSESTGDAILDSVLAEITKSNAKRTFNYWVGNIGYIAHRFERTILDSLITKGIVGKQRDKRFVFFRKTVYSLRKPETLKALRQEWRQKIRNSDRLDGYDKEWIGILHATDLGRIIFPEENEWQYLKKQVNEIYRESFFGSIVSHCISMKTKHDHYSMTPMVR